MKDKVQIEIDAALFAVSELAMIAGIERGLADVWVHRRIVKPTQLVKMGGRRRPLFSVRAIFHAKLVRLLVEHIGIGPSDSSLAVDAEAPQVAEMLSSETWVHSVVRNLKVLEFWIAVSRIDGQWKWKLLLGDDEMRNPGMGDDIPVVLLPVTRILEKVVADCERLQNDSEPPTIADGTK